MSEKYQERFQRVLEAADVKIDGDRPWDIQVHDKRIYGRILREGTLGMGEAYMDGWWDCERIDMLVDRIYKTGVSQQLLKVPGLDRKSTRLNSSHYS